ncbi:MAG TPA: TIM barrel protein, partial [Opitutaceae bacterium]|nr:TIM barrel protein [Opitutaceae bacterium]
MTADLPPLELYLHYFNFRFRHRQPPGFDVHALIDTASRLGFSGVNLWVKGPEYYFLGGADEAHLDAIRRRLDRHGLGIDLETHGTEPAHLEAVLGIARRLRADNLRTYTLRRSDPREQIESAVRDLRVAAPLAEQAGVRLLLENHEDLTATQVAEILARVDHPQLGALFDYGNSAVFMEEPAESLRVLARHSRTAHLKDHVTIPAGAAGNAEPLWLGVPLGQVL